MKNQNPWLKKLQKEFLSKPGEHLIEVGITGSGKTQGLYWILDGLLTHNPHEIIVWFDTGKSSEIIRLAKFKALNVIIPEGTDINIKCDAADIIIKRFINTREIWTDLLVRDRINVICLEPYILDPSIYTKLFTTLFGELIRLAHNCMVPVPLAIFVDEFHRLAPSKGNAIDQKQIIMGAILQHNIERLRSLKIRFVCTTHGWMKIRSGVRNSFNWILARRGAHLSKDQPKLSRFNPLFEKLNTDEGILSFPTKIFTDIMHLPFYENGEDLGEVKYTGIFENTGRSSKNESGAKNAWTILGIKLGSSWKDIKAAYRDLALKYHPDKTIGLPPHFIKIAEEMMKEINAAYEELRKTYEPRGQAP